MVLPALFSALLFGCGGGGGGNSAPTTATGVFVDSPVAGLAYTSGGLSGVTSADGSFTCEAGQPVRFSIGNLQLPSGTCVTGAVVTPLTIFGTADVNDIRVVNLARFLQTLDQNGYPDDGINIAAQVSSNAANLPATLDFGSNTFDTDVSAFFSDVFNAGLTSNTTLVSTVSATKHLQNQFSSIAGSWFLTNGGGKTLITFFANGDYVHAQSGPLDPSGHDGMERGTYTWNPTTGAFVSPCPTVDTNGEWGLSHQGSGVCSGTSTIVTVSGNTLTIDGVTLFRVVP